MDVSPSLLARLGETEYAKVVDPAFLEEAPCGDVYRRPDFPDRHDGNQLVRARCPADELVREVEVHFGGTGLGYRRVSGHDPGIWRGLAPDLEGRGWTVAPEAMKVFRGTSDGAASPELEIRAVDPWCPDLETLYTRDGSLDRGFVFERGEHERVGGEHLVGYHAGEPVTCTGWFAAGGVARYRHVYTRPRWRGRGFASAMVRHVRGLPEVRAQDALVIFVGEGGPDALYERLGFETAGWFWSALLETD